MNKKWRDALLVAARNLRQNVLKGRIWGGDPSPIPSPSPSFASAPISISAPASALPPDPSPSSSPTRSQSVFYSNPTFNSSSSSVESSASFSTGDEDATGGAALGRAKARRYRNGRVRGMVETLERSGSFSSDGGFDDEAAAPSGSANRARKQVRELAQVQAQVTGQRIVNSPSPSKRRPLPVPPSPNGSASNTLLDEEPTMEALLAELAKGPPVTGARAWEEVDLANGITVKRVPVSAHDMTIGQKTIQGLGSGRISGGSSNGKGGERRVVTAIFAPHAHASVSDAEPPTAPVPLKPLDSSAIADLNALAKHAEDNASAPTPPPDEQLSPSKSASRPLPEPPVPEGAGAHAGLEAEAADARLIQIERMLEEEILATRGLVDTFRARLEIVEQKVADLEAHEALRAAAELEQQQAQVQAQAQAQTRSQAQTPPLFSTQPQSQPRDQAAAARASVEIGVQAESESADATVRVPVRAAVADAAVQSDGDTQAQLHPSASPSPASLNVFSAAAEPQPQPQFMPGAVDPEMVGTGDGVLKREDDDDDDGDELPSHLSDLPSYVLLAGLGVCAVVTQVVVRRVFGKGMLRP